MTNTLTRPTLMEQTIAEVKKLRDELRNLTTHELKNFTDQLHEVNGTMKSIKEALLGSEFSSEDGLIDQVKNLKKRVALVEEDVSRFKLFSKWTITAASIIGGAIGSAVIFVWNLFKH